MYNVSVQRLRVTIKNQRYLFSAVLMALVFFTAYSVLTIVRHDHYQSFGYDLGINDQLVWRYSTFQSPIVTIAPVPDRTKFVEHVELIYSLIAPFYWIWSSRQMLLLVQAAIVSSGAIAIFLLARSKKLYPLIQLAIPFSYLTFYGLQNAVWFDVHSASMVSGILAWFIYFLETKNQRLTVLFFLIAITTKENIAFITLFITLVYFLRTRENKILWYSLASLCYLVFIFFIFYPHIMHVQYPYQNKGGLFSHLNPLEFIDTAEKRKTLFFTFLSFGFMPFFAPLSLIPPFADLATYFVIGSDLPGAQGLFMQYRITLAPVLSLGTILAVSNFRRLNTKWLALYLFICALFVQYVLHLPLSYLTKSWFWEKPAAVNTINTMRDNYLSKNASVVSQNNITPHISHRDKIYTLYPEKKNFSLTNSPCGEKKCDWFYWFDKGNPHYLIVDTSEAWDARHLLADRGNFIKGLTNMEKTGVIKRYKQIGTTILYTIQKSPNI